MDETMGDVQKSDSNAECPICGKSFVQNVIEVHVNRCIFLNSSTQNDMDKPKEVNNKRPFRVFSAAKTSGVCSQPNRSPDAANKRSRSTNALHPNKSPSTLSTAQYPRLPIPTKTIPVSDDEDDNDDVLVNMPSTSTSTTQQKVAVPNGTTNVVSKSIPLAEKMRPESIDDYIGQTHILGKNAILRKILEKNETPSMILWGKY